MKTQAQQGYAGIEIVLAAHGFQREGSGGNCEWFVKEHGNGTYTCITDEHGHAVPDRMDRPARICTYDENGFTISDARFAALQDYIDQELAQRCREVVEKARADLGEGLQGLTDLVLDNIPGLKSIEHARACLDAAGIDWR